MGKLVFLDLVDRSGKIQLLVAEDRAGPVDLDLGDIVGVTGIPAKTKRGEPSLAVTELELLAKIKRPLPDTFHGLTETETRYRQRYLDLLMSEESRADFELRARMVAAIRRYLDDRGFVEVETPILQPRYGGALADPFVTHSNELDQDLYLRIATELYLKRLIVGGLERVYELAKDFRNEGVSYKHAPEFTMVEWYEAYADYNDTMARIEELVETVAQQTIGTTKVTFRGHDIDLKAPWKRVKLVEALEEKGLWTRDADDLRKRLDERGVDTSANDSWSGLVDHALSHFVEPELIEPTILHDYPVELSPFARPTDDDPDDRRALRVLHRRDGARERVHGDQRPRRAGRALRPAGGGHGRPAGRPGLRRGARLRDAADRRARARNRPPRHGADRQGEHPGHDPLPGSARAHLTK